MEEKEISFEELLESYEKVLGDLESTKATVDELMIRVQRLEKSEIQEILTAFVAHFDRPHVIECVETAVCNVFDIRRASLYNSLAVGNKYGKRKRNVVLDPKYLEDIMDRITLARQCLYPILHYDFHISLPKLQDWYNTNVYGYLQDWKYRYPRVMIGTRAEPESLHDDAYREYWVKIYKETYRICKEKGLIGQLERILQENSDIADNKVERWR